MVRSWRATLILAVLAFAGCIETEVEQADSSTHDLSIFADYSSLMVNNFGISSLAMDSQGNAYAVSGFDGKIIKFSADGTATDFATAPNAFMLASDKNDNIYAATWASNILYKIAPDGTVSNFANIDSFPTGLAVDSAGHAYYTATPLPNYTSSNVIKKIAPDGTVTVFAGSGAAGFVNGNGTATSFNGPTGLAVDDSGNVFVVDVYNYVIRKITPSGDVTTFAGNGSRGVVDGSAQTASLSFRTLGAQVTAIAVSSEGDLYVESVYGVGLIRKIDRNGNVSRFCGNGDDQGAVTPGPCNQSKLYSNGIAAGPNGTVFFNDGYGHLAKITPVEPSSD